MNQDTCESPISALLEGFPLYQKILLSNIDLKHLNMTKTQLCILFALSGNSFLSMSQIAAYIASSKEQATRAVAPLVAEGYVRRIYDEQNRTRVLIQLSDHGRKIILQEQEFLQQSLAERFNALSSEDREIFQEAVYTSLRILKKLGQ